MPYLIAWQCEPIFKNALAQHNLLLQKQHSCIQLASERASEQPANNGKKSTVESEPTLFFFSGETHGESGEMHAETHDVCSTGFCFGASGWSACPCGPCSRQLKPGWQLSGRQCGVWPFSSGRSDQLLKP
jgi:hypothetical protein